MANSSVVSIRLNNDDRALLERAAKEENLTLPQYILSNSLDRVEDMLDIIKIKKGIAHLHHHPEDVVSFETIKARYGV